MSGTITLKDHTDGDVTYHRIFSDANSMRYVTRGASLLGNSQLDLRIDRRANVNRVYAKLSLPTVCVDAQSCGKTVVQYTEVGSLDLSSVLMADEDARNNFIAQFASLASKEEVAAMFTDGIMPA